MNSETTTNIETKSTAPILCAEGATETTRAVECRTEAENTTTPERTAESIARTASRVVTVLPKRIHRPHRSKISELPVEIRTFVNKSISNHVPYSKICEQLAEKGHPGINTTNIGRWVKHGYPEWQQKEERIESVCLKLDNVKDHVEKFKTNGVSDCVEFNRLMLAAQLTQTMCDFDPNHITNGLAEKPGRFYKLARLINTQVLESQRQEKIQLIREKFCATQPTGPTAAGEQAVRLAFGIPDSWCPSGTRQKPS